MHNKNNHPDERSCIAKCVEPKQRAVCLLPKIAGNCDRKLKQWYYDFSVGLCRQMTYTGCNGNLNRFESRETCEYTCQGLALQGL